MQNLINYYFKQLCDDKFFENNEEVIIGKAKDVIKNLKEQAQYVKNPENNIDQDEIKFITSEVADLINTIKEEYPNKNDVIKISINPMVGFYELIDAELLLEELKIYYEELGEQD